jgi:hypothetical protein
VLWLLYPRLKENQQRIVLKSEWLKTSLAPATIREEPQQVVINNKLLARTAPHDGNVVTGPYWNEIRANLETIFSNWISILLGVVLITLTCLVVIKWQTRRGKTPTVV